MGEEIADKLIRAMREISSDEDVWRCYTEFRYYELKYKNILDENKEKNVKMKKLKSLLKEVEEKVNEHDYFYRDYYCLFCAVEEDLEKLKLEDN